MEYIKIENKIKMKITSVNTKVLPVKYIDYMKGHQEA